MHGELLVWEQWTSLLLHYLASATFSSCGEDPAPLGGTFIRSLAMPRKKTLVASFLAVSRGRILKIVFTIVLRLGYLDSKS